MRRLIHLVCLFALVSIEAKVIHFGNEMETSVKPQALWKELDLALKNSRNSWLWPKSSSVVGEGLKNGSSINVTYQFGIVHPTYRYLLEVRPEELSFTYLVADENHPFSGGAMVKIVPLKEGSLLVWEGEYDTDGSGILSRMIFQRFEKGFFRELEENLRANAL